MEPKKKALMAKVGLDGHDWGVKVICQAFRNTGMEVIYTGLRQTPELIVATALDEDVDVIGVSVHSGAHMYHVLRILALLKESKVEDVVVIVGGTIPRGDAEELKGMGVREVFPTDSDTGEAIRLVQGLPPRATH